ncbi:unnamed protein product [Brachionus calyciflorus]|uniref:Uncharacterized protein n=1 Tax=Brachionus calyciflorus TaxID=104777 RepID=A0A813N742_9BILA|nr:unnamed protein product [Brachionus calyciflorus]
MKALFYLTTLLILLQLTVSFPSKRFLFSDTPVIDEPDEDWNSLKFDEIELDTSEIGIKPDDLYLKIKECVQKCMKEVNSDRSYRDNCIAKMCDIY